MWTWQLVRTAGHQGQGATGHPAAQFPQRDSRLSGLRRTGTKRQNEQERARGQNQDNDSTGGQGVRRSDRRWQEGALLLFLPSLCLLLTGDPQSQASLPWKFVGDDPVAQGAGWPREAASRALAGVAPCPVCSLPLHLLSLLFFVTDC